MDNSEEHPMMCQNALRRKGGGGPLSVVVVIAVVFLAALVFIRTLLVPILREYQLP